MSCCEDREGRQGYNWHKIHGTDPCETAREKAKKVYQDSRRARAEAEGRTFIPKPQTGVRATRRRPRWTPGTPILVEEIEEL